MPQFLKNIKNVAHSEKRLRKTGLYLALDERFYQFQNKTKANFKQILFARLREFIYC